MCFYIRIVLCFSTACTGHWRFIFLPIRTVVTRRVRWCVCFGSTERIISAVFPWRRVAHIQERFVSIFAHDVIGQFTTSDRDTKSCGIRRAHKVPIKRRTDKVFRGKIKKTTKLKYLSNVFRTLRATDICPIVGAIFPNRLQQKTKRLKSTTPR